jgi:hypothetical protein
MKRREQFAGWLVMLRRNDGSEFVALSDEDRPGRSILRGTAFFSTRRAARVFVKDARAAGLDGRVCRSRVDVWSEK